MSTPTPRAAVTSVPAYVPGKPPTPRPGLTSYKLSSNENPYPPLPGVVEAVMAAVGQMNRYPDMGAVQMYDALAGHLGVRPEELAAGTGSVAVLYHLLQAYCDPGDEVVYAWRSFEAYPIAVSVSGAVSVQVPLGPGARHDLDAMAAAVTDRTKVVVVCSPNNPTGPSVTQTELAAFLDQVPGRVVVVVDEAYREFVRMDDVADPMALRERHPNLVVMRTFAKAYGLAGLRVGYAVAHPDVAAAIRACALPFGVSTAAQTAVIASLAAEPELLRRVDDLVEERARVHTGLLDQGWDVPEAQGNFVWLSSDQVDPERLTKAADEAGLMVRPFPEGVRISIGEREANTRLLEVTATLR